MTEPGHDLEYRQEILSKLFRFIKSSESCFLVGGGSSGKTRLLDFLMRSEVQKAYLAEKAEQTLIIRVDMNRVSEFSEWGFYELMLTTIVQFCALDSQHDELGKLGKQLMKEFVVPLLNEPNTLKALRFLELTISNIMICDDFKICFIFDEFDGAYQKLPAKVFSHLRAIRDANKTRLSYALLLRHLPEQLRKPDENESFYELLSRNMIGIGPYTAQDTTAMLKQLEARHGRSLQVPFSRETIHRMSGGHSGLIQAIFTLIVNLPLQEGDARLVDSQWLLGQDVVKEECRKLFESLTEAEQLGIREFACGKPGALTREIQKVLFAKGLLKLDEQQQQTKVFSPIFELHLK